MIYAKLTHTVSHTAGAQGMAAIRRSWALVRPLRWHLAVPFVGLIVLQRLAEAAKGVLLTALPPLVPGAGGDSHCGGGGGGGGVPGAEPAARRAAVGGV